ncbi:hypothetical protein OAH08_02895 [Verrucomicrobia bacterium]|nr:hypothetical protein [Verrucomicrobiota bacterium]MDB4704926.1 hypothetical protein [Verrucomicrobiota bacterium]MDB4777283.1 hypothetical protein [Verrucomicrobiota bacterium]
MLLASDLWIHPSSRYLLRWFVALFDLFEHLRMRSDTYNTHTHVMHGCYALLIMGETD